MKRQTKSLIVLGILVVLCVGAFVGIRLWNNAQDEKAAADKEAATIHVGGVSDAAAISFSNESGSYDFVRNAQGSWVYAEDEAFPLNGDNLDDIEAAVVGLTAVYAVDMQDDARYYGLDAGKTLSVTDSNGVTLDLVLGAQAPDGSNYYAMLADGSALYTISGDLNRYTKLTLLDMAGTREFPDVDQDNLLSVTVEGRFGSMTLDKETADVDGEKVYTWYVTTPDCPRTLLSEFDIPLDVTSYSSTDKYLTAVVDDDLAYIALNSCVYYRPTAEELAQCGLDAPKYVITVVYETDELNEDGSAVAAAFSFRVGNYDTVLDENGEEIIPTLLARYVQIDGDSLLCLMDEDDIERMEMTYFEFCGHDLDENPVGVHETADGEA